MYPLSSPLPVRAARAATLLLLLAAAAPAPRAGAQAARAPARPPADTAAPAAARGPRVLLAAPEGDTLGVMDPAARMEVVGREGEWARVRVEGWVRVAPGAELASPGPLATLSLQALRAEPERYRGQSIAWEVQFVALQKADSLRAEFAPGEPYMLVRDPGGEPGFVYVAVPPALLPAVRRLGPLQKVQLVGRVRTGRSELMGHPVLELIEIRR